MNTELDKIFRTQRKYPDIGKTDYSTAMSMEYVPGETETEKMVRDLQRQVVYNDQGMDLIPLQLIPGGIHGATLRVTESWKDNGLRKHYLPELPYDHEGVGKVLEKWSGDPNKLVYFCTENSHFDLDGYLTLTFSDQVNAPAPRCRAWLTYGMLHPERQRQGIMQRAVGTALEHLAKTIPTYDLAPTEILTSVGEFNPASAKILRNNGFEIDYRRQAEKCPTASGGISYPVYLILK